MTLLPTIIISLSILDCRTAVGFQQSAFRQLTFRPHIIHSSFAVSASKNDDFSEFDPLVSPHEYADGIDATLQSKRQQQGQEQDEPKNPTQDDNFDPLLSPHAYPKGTGGKGSKSIEDDDDWTPFKMNSVAKDFRGASESDYKVQRSHFTRQWSLTINSTPKTSPSPGSNTESVTEDFDPLLSPHAYPNGIAAGSVDLSKMEKKQTIGVLIIDHGSRRAQSNERLHHIAQLYQERAPSDYIVRAAHMEIASPSIKETLIEMVRDEKVSKVVCHPYFLSPGRHVTEDIPELIEEAVEVIKSTVDLSSLDQDLDVILTDPLGSKLDVMVDIISNTIDESLGISAQGSDTKSELGGLFGEIKQMLDEQL